MTSAWKFAYASKLWTIISLQFMLIATIMPKQAMARFTSFKLTSDYEKRDPPKENGGDKPLKILVILEIIDITDVKEDKNEISMDIVAYLAWTENRIEFTEPFKGEGFQPLDDVDVSMLWIPESYYSSMIDLNTLHGKMDLTFVSIDKNKCLLHITRSKLSLKCYFNFELFPMDVQTCTIEFLCPSSTTTTDDVILDWDWKRRENPGSFRGNTPFHKRLPGHEATLIPCKNPIKTKFIWGYVSKLRMKLILQRDLRSYILDTYMPTILFVVMSWGSFLVKPDIVPGRMVLLVTNLLSLVTLYEANRNDAPPTLSVKAVEIWLVSCIFFVFLALIEYGLVLYGLLHSTSKNKTSRLQLFIPFAGIPMNEKNNRYKKFRKLKTKLLGSKFWLYQRLLKMPEDSTWVPLDKGSVAFFPLLFAIYNIIYWSYFISRRDAILASTGDCSRP